MIWVNNNIRGVAYVQDSDGRYVGNVHIGMADVNSINYSIQNNTAIKKGDEVGYFAFGGSSVIVIFEKGYLKEFNVKVGQHIQMGQQVATKA